MGRWILTPEGALNLDQLTKLTIEGGPRWWIVLGWTITGDRVVVRESFTSDEDAVAWIRKETRSHG